VVVGVPLGVVAAHFVSMAIDEHAAHGDAQMTGLVVLIVEGLLFGPWIAFGTMVRQREIFARNQALAFELERSELERNALEARLRLLQAQVQPHFLFNTLANVQALVDAGSPQASQVLASLIAYLRAAVPRLHELATTLGQELDLVRAYLELMRMRMPDRLEFELDVDPAATALQCPPMTLLTLVENAVRHGIDPSEEGGRIDVDVRVSAGRCRVRVRDTGRGFASAGSGLGTGLSTLRERLKLAFDGDVRVQVTEIEPHGVCAELDFPARREFL
jgi:LytS/YehU family sensor histidine kinase